MFLIYILCVNVIHNTLSYTWLLLHVSVINCHPQGDIIQTYKTNTTNLHIQCYQYHIKENYGGHEGKNIDIIDNVMLTYSWIKFINVPLFILYSLLLYA